MINAVPKPKYKKHRAVNNPKPTIDDICAVCGRPYVHNHEVFFGKNRQNSIKYKMQIRLCEEHHEGPNSPHHNKTIDDELKREYQTKFEAEYGQEFFIEVFGKDYIRGCTSSKTYK